MHNNKTVSRKYNENCWIGHFKSLNAFGKPLKE
nr:MAG TPA: putative lipoprotein family protein [Caudoviricetes sp.]